MTPIFLVHISEFLFKIQTVAGLFPIIHHHCRRVSLSLSSMISKSHFSLYLLSKLIDIWFLLFLCLISLFLYFKLFLCLILPLFLFFSFKPITRRIWPGKPKNRDKRFRPTIWSTRGEKFIHSTWVGRVMVWPQTQFARPVDDLSFRGISDIF